ncbi:hypothetical protein BX600DRAFT_469995 [Xylariales sp. PMI_506]|nr:hypothetical protein BX600DRAFT_469995 [Xylariales sp. PMI_506]
MKFSAPLKVDRSRAISWSSESCSRVSTLTKAVAPSICFFLAIGLWYPTWVTARAYLRLMWHPSIRILVLLWVYSFAYISVGFVFLGLAIHERGGLWVDLHRKWTPFGIVFDVSHWKILWDSTEK